jgi:uncharacterized protein YfdQ (DUF2303 family)
MDSQDNIQAIIDLARSIGAKVDSFLYQGVEGLIASVPHRDGGVEIVDLKKFVDNWRTAPERKEGTATALTLQSLIELFNRHKDDKSAIFAETTAAPKIVAVLDYHGDTPRFGRHRIAYEFPASVEWPIWRENDNVSMTQADFAEFIEANVADLDAPTSDDEFLAKELLQTTIATPAEIFSLSRGLSFSAELNIKEVRNLPNGTAQIVYDEQHKDGGGKPLVIPGAFILCVPFFFGGKVARIIARLRYKRTSGGIKWSYHLWRWQDSRREIILADLDAVREATQVPVYEGIPER